MLDGMFSSPVWFIPPIIVGKSPWKTFLKGEVPLKKTWKGIGWNFSLSHSKRTNRISSLRAVRVGNSWTLPIGAGGDTRLKSVPWGELQRAAFSKTSQSGVQKVLSISHCLYLLSSNQSLIGQTIACNNCMRKNVLHQKQDLWWERVN